MKKYHQLLIHSRLVFARKNPSHQIHYHLYVLLIALKQTVEKSPLFSKHIIRDNQSRSIVQTLLNCASAFASSSRILCGSSLLLLCTTKSREKVCISCSVCCLYTTKNWLCKNPNLNFTWWLRIVMISFCLRYELNDFPMLPTDYSVPEIENYKSIKDILFIITHPR